MEYNTLNIEQYNKIKEIIKTSEGYINKIKIQANEFCEKNEIKAKLINEKLLDEKSKLNNFNLGKHEDIEMIKKIRKNALYEEFSKFDFLEKAIQDARFLSKGVKFQVKEHPELYTGYKVMNEKELTYHTTKLADTSSRVKRKMRKKLDGYYDENQMLIDFYMNLKRIKEEYIAEMQLKIQDDIKNIQVEKEESYNIILLEKNIIDSEKADFLKNSASKIASFIEKAKEQIQDESKLVKSFSPAYSKMNEITVPFDNDIEKPFGHLYAPLYESNQSEVKRLNMKCNRVVNAMYVIDYYFTFKNNFSYFIKFNAETDNKIARGLQSLILNILTAKDEVTSNVNIFYIDMYEKAADLGKLLKLDGFPVHNPRMTVANTQNSFHSILKNLEGYVNEVVRIIAGYSDVYEYNKYNENKIPLKLLVLNNFGVGYDNVIMNSLEILFESLKRCGVCTIILCDKDKEVMYKEYLNKIKLNECITIYSNKDKTFINDFEFKFLENERVMELCEEILDALSNQKIKNDFIIKETNLKNAVKEIEIPFAVTTSGEEIKLKLGSSISPHALLIGKTGSGKSTSLHTIIQGVAMNYNSDEVELWLVDYKINEFAYYLKNNLPHIKVLGLDRSIDFTFSLLDEIKNEQTRRTELFLKAKVSGYEEYRNQNFERVLPRIMVMIDEFHVLSQHINEDGEYKQLLENLLSECRSVGISFLFSDQSLQEGLRGFTNKGKQQVSTRLAMMNTDNEIKETLQLSNDYYTEEFKKYLENMGQGDIVIKQTTNDAVNSKMVLYRARVLFADNIRKKEIFNLAIESCKDCIVKEKIVIENKNRKVYNEKEVNRFEQKYPSKENIIPIYLGTPFTFKESFKFELKKGANQNILVLSDSDEIRKSLLQLIIKSFGKVSNDILVLADPFDEFYQNCQHIFSDNLIKVITDYNDVCKFIYDTVNDTSIRKTDKLLIWFGIDAMYDEFDIMPYEINKNVSNKTTNRYTTEINSLMTDIDNMLLEYEVDKKENEKTKSEEEIIDYKYNAKNDLSKLFLRCPRNKIYSLVLFDSYSTLNRTSGFKKEYFQNKLVSKIEIDDARMLLGSKDEMETMDANSVVYKSIEKHGKVFLPYMLEGD